ncbi:MAG: AAA family ATPase [Paludibacteraceae bacterium]|nr:AAA family ATPase [Paludibacteraceae bacterium]
MNNSKRLKDALHFAENFAISSRLEFITPELLLVGICCRTNEFVDLCESYHVDYQKDLKEPIYGEMIEHVPDDVAEYELLPSVQFIQMMTIAETYAQNADKEEVDVPHVLHAILQLQDSQANFLLRSKFTGDVTELLRSIIDVYDGRELPDHHPERNDAEDETVFIDPFSSISKPQKWTELVLCVNEQLDKHNPLIGRQVEIERTIQVLCRRDKNNPLHVGEPGVGKTALIYGLAQRIENGDVPERLQGAKIYQMDMGSLVAGTQYRGEFEERILRIMKGIAKQPNAIVYIDEIHTLIGAGATSGDSLDGSNILKPYLEAGDIRFIGATTYKEYNKYFQKSQGIVRRFQKIDIPEPSQEETVRILEELKPIYEQFHHVRYQADIMRYTVELSCKYISDRFLPDKAIDLIDEAGAYRELHPLTKKTQLVDRKLIDETVKRICKISDDMFATSYGKNNQLATLQEHLSQQIFGQPEAIRQVVETVQLAKAGFNEPDKPLASLLFVGPTGVGKTELCRVLAKELGVELIRFDMSEYTEKHAVAKLIGAPAGYVGYEDGGLLTDAVRRAPNCVLLLDEIEKAHQDIYNILLQVMDYACLTDNKGNKADFKNVILIMTSNAGAQSASIGSVGFATSWTRGNAMLDAVKKTFKPEFINRLSATVVFNDMSREMASSVLNKKLSILQSRLKNKNVVIKLSNKAHDFLINEGFSERYGAREMDRVIRNHLNTLLMKEILFGQLKDGGKVYVERVNNSLALKYK